LQGRNRTRTRRTLLATIALTALLPAARAAAAPHLVVWAGGLEPGSLAHGVELRADGRGARLLADAHGHVRVHGAFRPRGARLAAIRSAGERLLAHGPNVTSAQALGGSYVTVVLEDGGRRRIVTDTNADSAAVRALLQRLNAALPRGARVPGAAAPGLDAPVSVHAHAASLGTAPTAAKCPEGQRAYDVVKQVSLADAAQAGLVDKLKSKRGVAGGDAVEVGADWGDMKAPVDITIHAEFQNRLDGPLANVDMAEHVQQLLQDAMPDMSIDGQPVRFHYDFVNRALGADPRPCYHEIAIRDDRDANGNPERSVNYEVSPPDMGQMHGSWQFTGLAGAVTHELMHLVGFRDDYTDYFHFTDGSEREDIPLPARDLEGDDLQAALPAGVDASDGVVIQKPDPGSEHGDLLAETGPELRPGDLANLTDGADLNIHADPGVVLVNKNGQDQNFVVGAPFDLRVPKDGSAEADGIVAYCIDLLNHETPGPGADTFDVLPKAGQLGGEAMDALQRVVDVVAAREPGALEETPGANAAIWRVTDNLSIEPDGDPAALAILAAAGVPPSADPSTGAPYDAPHFLDPAAAISQPVALTSPQATAPLPPPPPVKPSPQFVLRGSKLVRLTASPRRLRLGRSRRGAFVIAHLALGGEPDQVSLALTRRRGQRIVTVARAPARLVAAGDAALVLYVRSLQAGTYRLVASSAHGGTLSTRVTLTRPHR
jgi:hypothetical protein